MTTEIYEIPDSVDHLFREAHENDGASYRIIDYSDGMEMDNIQSMQLFIECVGIDEAFIVEDEGTQIVLEHPDYGASLVIDSGGLGDFFSHGFDCHWDNE